MTGEELPGRLALTVGEQREIELPSLSTAGYVWQHELEDGADALDVDWRRAPLAAGRPVGESAPEVVVLRAKRPGRAHLRLLQRRPWERDVPPLHEHELELEIGA
jgi:predicted secreted protein